MITILLCMIIAVAWSIRGNYLQGYADFIDYVLWGLLCGIFGLCIGVAIAFMIPMNLKNEMSYLKLASLQDGSSSTGRFFLGSGNIDSEPKFTFYVSDNGVYELKQVKSSASKIMHSNNQARVKVTTLSMVKGSIINYFGLDSNIGDKTYLFEVPEGSVKNDYILDAK